MQSERLFYINSVLFGAGLAVDAFLIALASGMKYPETRRAKVVGIAAVFLLFHFCAALGGWGAARAAYASFSGVKPVFSGIAVCILLVLGVKLFFERDGTCAGAPGSGRVIAECIAASADALSVGFTAEELDIAHAVLCAGIISVAAFIAYCMGFAVGRRFGVRFRGLATVLGGIAFIAIAAEIIVTTYV